MGPRHRRLEEAILKLGSSSAQEQQNGLDALVVIFQSGDSPASNRSSRSSVPSPAASAITSEELKDLRKSKGERVANLLLDLALKPEPTLAQTSVSAESSMQHMFMELTAAFEVCCEAPTVAVLLFRLVGDPVPKVLLNVLEVHLPALASAVEALTQAPALDAIDVACSEFGTQLDQETYNSLAVGRLISLVQLATIQFTPEPYTWSANTQLHAQRILQAGTKVRRNLAIARQILTLAAVVSKQLSGAELVRRSGLVQHTLANVRLLQQPTPSGHGKFLITLSAMFASYALVSVPATKNSAANAIVCEQQLALDLLPVDLKDLTSAEVHAHIAVEHPRDHLNAAFMAWHPSMTSICDAIAAAMLRSLGDSKRTSAVYYAAAALCQNGALRALVEQPPTATSSGAADSSNHSLQAGAPAANSSSSTGSSSHHTAGGVPRPAYPLNGTSPLLESLLSQGLMDHLRTALKSRCHSHGLQLYVALAAAFRCRFRAALVADHLGQENSQARSDSVLSLLQQALPSGGRALAWSAGSEDVGNQFMALVQRFDMYGFLASVQGAVDAGKAVSGPAAATAQRAAGATTALSSTTMTASPPSSTSTSTSSSVVSGASSSTKACALCLWQPLMYAEFSAWEVHSEPLPGSKLRLCARCKVVHYCSGSCQRAHWSGGHKRVCKASK